MKKFASILLAAVMAGSLAACAAPAPQAQPAAPAAEEAEPAAEAEAAEAEAAEAEAEPAAEEAAEPAEGEEISLRFSWWGGDSRHAATIAAAEAFTAKYPNIKVETEYGAWDGWTTKIATQLSSNTAADVMQFNHNWVYQYSSDGSKLVDLNDYADIIALENYPESMLDACTVAGKLQGLPLGMNTKCFWWNKTTFDAAGVEIPETWDDLYAAGETFKEVLGDDYYPMAMYPYERMLLMVYYLQNKYDKAWAENNEIQFSEEEILEGLEWLNMLVDKHVMPTVQQMQGDGASAMEQNPNWVNGHYAGFYEWDSTYQKVQNVLEEGQEFVYGHHLTDGTKPAAASTKITQLFVIASSCEHPKEAAMLIQFLVDDEEGVKIMSTERGSLLNPHANEVLEKEGLLSGLGYDNKDEIQAAGKYPLDPNFENSELKDDTGIYYQVMEALTAGDDPAELASFLLEECKSVYENNAF